MSYWFTYDSFNPKEPSEYWRGASSRSMPSDGVKGMLFEPWAQKIKKDEDGKDENWSSDDFVAGIKIVGDVVAVFRIFDGGRDEKSRPGRWVMLLAEGTRDDFAGTDILKAVESPVFQEFLKNAKGKTVEPPSCGEIPRESGEMFGSVEFNKSEINGEDEIRKVSLAFTRDKLASGLLLVKKLNGVLTAQTDFQRKMSSSSTRPSGVSGRPTKKALPQKNGESNRKTTLMMVLIAFLVGLLIPMFFLKAKCDEFKRYRTQHVRLAEQDKGLAQKKIEELKKLCPPGTTNVSNASRNWKQQSKI